MIPAALLAPFGYFVLHCVAARLPWLSRRPPQGLAALVAIVGFTVESIGLAWAGGTSLNGLVFSVVCSAGAAQLYFHLFNMSETARRIRLVVCRYLGEPIPEESGWKESTKRRLERLRSMGEVRRVGSRWTTRNGPLTRLAKGLVAYEHGLFPERARSTENGL